MRVARARAPRAGGSARGLGTVRVLTWNLFHGRDGLPGLGPTPASTWRDEPVDDGVHMHVNRKLTGHMARRIAAWSPDACALQEVPAAAIDEIVAATGMRAVWVRTGPLVGPAVLRDALARRNPDLWRSGEGSANVLLLRPELRPDGRPATLTLNPVAGIPGRARALGLGADELRHYLVQRRRMVMARVVPPEGPPLAIACVHCHNARDPRLTGLEIGGAAAAVSEMARGGPVVLAGDLNVRPDHPALAALAADGWEGADPWPGAGIDRILHRGIAAAGPQRRPDPAEREIGVWWRGRRRRVRLSDHDPVIAELAA